MFYHPACFPHQIYHVFYQTCVAISGCFTFAVPYRDEANFINAACQRGIECPAVISFMHISALLGQANMVGLMEFIHQWVVSHLVETLSPFFAAGADEFTDIRRLRCGEIG